MTKTTLAALLTVAAQMTALAADAYAEGFNAKALKVYAADPLDTARTANGRLRKTRYEESNEQAFVRLFGDGVNGIYVQMQSGSLKDASGNTIQPVHRQQLACTPFKLVPNADGTVTAQATGLSKFITDNVGQDYRNANLPNLYAINGGQHMLVTFNYRVQGTNDTDRYAKVVDNQCNLMPVQNASGSTVKQVRIMHKNNDNCDMSQTGEGAGVIASDAGGVSHLTYWAGCNGNGRDDGWINDVTISALNGGTAFKIAKNFDASLEPQEERSRGRCTVSDDDPNTAICTWTAGNNQPQREGTWIGAVNIGPGGETGENAQSRILWKKKIEGQKIVSNVRTYSVRANSSRVLALNPDGTVKTTDTLFVATADLRGNNTNNRKGGRYLQQNLGVARATKTGLEWVVPMTDITNQMLGFDATHLTMTAVLIQDGSKVVPAMSFLQGTQFGGGSQNADEKFLALDDATKKFVDYGSHPAGASYDRHLYSNYLGGNPGNQGRNFAGTIFALNPAAKTDATASKFLLVQSLTGKDSADVMKPEIKQSGYISVMTLSNPQAAPPPPAGTPNTGSTGQNASGGGQNSAPQPGDPDMPATPGNFSMGCSMVSVDVDSAGVFFLLLGLGIVALVSRRRA
jgi:hypothetical protein